MLVAGHMLIQGARSCHVPSLCVLEWKGYRLETFLRLCNHDTHVTARSGYGQVYPLVYIPRYVQGLNKDYWQTLRTEDMCLKIPSCSLEEVTARGSWVRSALASKLVWEFGRRDFLSSSLSRWGCHTLWRFPAFKRLAGEDGRARDGISSSYFITC